MRVGAPLATCAVAAAGSLATAGCGTGDRLSARFSEGSGTTAEGVFDWSARRGWVEQVAGPGGAFHVIQIGDDCYERFGGEWKHDRTQEPSELCEGIPLSPTQDFDLHRRIADRWQEVGRRTIRGAPTTLYRGHIHIGALKTSFELWVDERGRVLRDRQVPDGETAATVMNYYDFGVHVDVKAPKPTFESGT